MVVKEGKKREERDAERYDCDDNDNNDDDDNNNNNK